jgi:MFS family permease
MTEERGLLSGAGSGTRAGRFLPAHATQQTLGRQRAARRPGATLALTLTVAAAVAVAFADSSIVVLALPELYHELGTSVVGVSWVITAFNLAVAAAVFALLPFLGRIRVSALSAAGLLVFLGASIGCGLSEGLGSLILCRAIQGIGAALLLAGSLPILARLSATPERGIAVWTMAATVGVSVGPALGGLLTEIFDWRAIFIAQAPIAALALLSFIDAGVRTIPPERRTAPVARTLGSNLGLLFTFAALVGALFLAVLLIVTVWNFEPLAGAGVVSALPFAALAVRPLADRLPGALDVGGGGALLALGLLALALLPSSGALYAGLALAVCGAGLGLATFPLTRRSVSVSAGLARSGTVSVGARHVGLVLGLVLVAPLLGYELDRATERATLNATASILDAPVPLATKVPLALDLRDAFEAVPRGEVPDLAEAFENNEADSDAAVAATQDSLLGAIEAALTRAFRSSFALAAFFALLALVPALLLPRRGRV